MSPALIIYNNPLTEWWYESGAALIFWGVIAAFIAGYGFIIFLQSCWEALRDLWQRRQERRRQERLNQDFMQ